MEKVSALIKSWFLKPIEATDKPKEQPLAKEVTDPELYPSSPLQSYIKILQQLKFKANQQNAIPVAIETSQIKAKVTNVSSPAFVLAALTPQPILSKNNIKEATKDIQQLSEDAARTNNLRSIFDATKDPSHDILVRNKKLKPNPFEEQLPKVGFFADAPSSRYLNHFKRTVQNQRINTNLPRAIH